MRPNTVFRLCLFVLALVLAGSPASVTGSTAVDVPSRLTDQEFWKLTEDLSEPNGSFRSENLLSNEMVLARMLPDVIARTKPGGVYLGVGPEQNFSYMAVTKPKMAFITDIRRGNLHVLLMYKALFELSADRVEFISRLFTKPRPAGISESSSITEIMDGFWFAKSADEAAYTANLTAIQRHLTKTHALPLGPEDLDGLARTYRAFYWYGPAMNYSATTSLVGGGGGGGATYRDLMTQADDKGQPLSYLGSEEKFKWLKDMNSRNMIVPLVGNFSGPKTIRAIGEYLKSRKATVSAFYVSTVEPYLRRDGSLPVFCENVATLPTDAQSVFIRPGNVQQLSLGNSMGANPATALPVRPAGPVVGSYQTGVVVPIVGGCG